MSTFSNKKERDIVDILKFIDGHENCSGIISMFIKGPPPNNDGYMYCTYNSSVYHWTEHEGSGLESVREVVIEKGWDSYGYGYMMGIIEQTIRDRYPPLPPPRPVLRRSLACACFCGRGGCNGCAEGEDRWAYREREREWISKAQKAFNIS